MKYKIELEKSQKASVRDLWVHEDHLINHRLTWLGVSQGILLGVYGFSLNFANNGDKQVKDLFEFWSCALPYIGLITSLLIFIGVLGAVFAMIKIYEIFKPERLGISIITTLMGQLCSIGLPLVFMFCWIFIIMKFSFASAGPECNIYFITAIISIASGISSIGCISLIKYNDYLKIHNKNDRIIISSESLKFRLLAMVVILLISVFLCYKYGPDSPPYMPKNRKSPHDNCSVAFRI